MAEIAPKVRELGLRPLEGDSFQPFSRSEVARLEAKVRGKLPPQYADFVLAFGASMFSVEVNCTPHGDPLYFGYFLSFAELMQSIEYLEEGMPKTIIPIADDGGGNLFLIGVGDEHFGRVYFHNHGLAWAADTVPEIAASFEEFVQRMVKEE